MRLLCFTLEFALIEIHPAIAILLIMLMIWLIVKSLQWIYRDAEARGKNGSLVATLAFFISWPMSLLFWIAFRPELKARRDRKA